MGRPTGRMSRVLKIVAHQDHEASATFAERNPKGLRTARCQRTVWKPSVSSFSQTRDPDERGIRWSVVNATVSEVCGWSIVGHNNDLRPYPGSDLDIGL